MLNGELRPMKRPDCDNIIKIILDALNGIAYRDDSQVVSVTARKFYDEAPHVDVMIFTKYAKNEQEGESE